MASNSSNGLAETLAAFDPVKRAPREALRPALIKAGHLIADAQEQLAGAFQAELKSFWKEVVRARSDEVETRLAMHVLQS